MFKMASVARQVLLTFISFHLFFFGFFPTQSSFFTSALEVNHTIDDASSGDGNAKITYTNPSQWSAGQNCDTCHVRPDPSRAFGGTWHDTSAFNNIASGQQVVVDFTGTGVYVYCILANTIPNAMTHSKFTFQMDGKPSGPDFNHNPASSNDYIYNALVYRATGLSNIGHTLTVNVDSGDPGSLMLFDYVTYTQVVADSAQPPPQSSPQPPTSDPSHASTSPSSGNVNTNSTLSNTLPPGSSAPFPTVVGNTVGGGTSQPSAGVLSPNGDDNAPASTLQGSSKKQPIGAIIGGIVAGVLGVCIIIAFYICMRRRRNTIQTQANATPYHSQWLQKNGSDANPYPSDILQSPASAVTLRPPYLSGIQPQRATMDLEAAINCQTPNTADPETISDSTSASGSETKLLQDNVALQHRVQALTEEVEMLREQREQIYRPTSFVSIGQSELPAYQPRESMEPVPIRPLRYDPGT